MMLKRALLALAVAISICLAIPIYLFYLSPNKGYYRTKYGLMPGEPLKLFGKVIDQYGEGVPGYRLEITPSFESSNTAFLHSPIRPYYLTTDEKGEFYFDSSPVRLRLCFYGSAESWGPEVIGSSYYDTSFYSNAQAEKMGDVIYFDGNRWMRDARKFSPIHVPLELPLIYLVGKSGPPQRQLEFYKQIDTPFHEESWFGINILDGVVLNKPGQACDIVGHATDLSYGWGESWKPYTVEFIASNGAGLQFAEDPFLNEAPPDGYKTKIEVKFIQVNGQWQREGAPYEGGGQPWPIYFYSHERQVYGVLMIHLGKTRNEITWTVTCRANPRGSRNLNKTEAAKNGNRGKEMKPVRPPITLPFVEPQGNGRPAQP